VTGWSDTSWYVVVNEWAHRATWLREPVVLFTNYGVVLLAIAAVLILWSVRHRGSHALATALWIPIAMVLTPGLGLVIKSVVAEPRPCRTLPDVPTLLPCDLPTDYAFPSNHSAICAAFAVALFLLHRRWGLLAGMFAVLMALSRVVVGVHYPHDVLAGLLLGALVGALGVLVRTRLAVLIDRVTPAQSRPGAAG
jgi:undecaprenyl-diphosphatase